MPMGVEQAYGAPAEEIARIFLGDPDEVVRKAEARERRLVYEQNIEQLLKNKIQTEWFDDPLVKERMSRFAFLGNSEGLFPRVVNEQARIVYATPPVRTIDPESEQGRFMALAEEVKLDQKMDAVTHRLVAHNDVVTYTRYVKNDRRVVIDVLTPDMVTIIPSPDDVTQPLAFIYCRKTWNPQTRKLEDWYVYWDSEVAFLLDAKYQRALWPGTASAELRHGLRRMPFLLIRRWNPIGRMWNRTEGNALIAAHFIAALCRVLGIRVLKAKVGKIPVISGDIKNFPRNQPLDEEGAILAPEGTQVTPLDLQTPTDGYTDFAEKVRTEAAADHGISRERMGQTGGTGDDTGLQEARADIIKVMEPAEGEQFDILRMVSQEHDDPEKRISDAAKMQIQYGDWQYRVDPKLDLEIWRERRNQGVGNVLEQIMARYRDVQTVDEALAKLLFNLEIESKWHKVMRELQIPQNSTTENPGSPAEVNGANGPLVRDGEKTRDEAAADARRERKTNPNDPYAPAE